MCLCDRANSPARGPRAWAGPGPHILNCFAGRAGPGLDILVAGRAGPGPHNSICGPGPGWVFTTAAGPGRAWASNHICGPGLGLDFRPVQDTSGHLTLTSIKQQSHTNTSTSDRCGATRSAEAAWTPHAYKHHHLNQIAIQLLDIKSQTDRQTDRTNSN